MEDNFINQQNVEQKEKIQKEENNQNNQDEKSEIEGVKILELDNNEDRNIDLSFKIILIGNSAVGKSSLIISGKKNKFVEDYNATIGFDYSSFFIEYENKVIKLQIWDTCGQEIYQSLITNFYRNSSLAILVFAINDRKSFDNLDFWLKEIKKESNPNVKLILIGNKVDLEIERVVSYEEAEKYSKNYNFEFYLETSAKTGFNTQKVFVNSALKLYEEYKKYKEFEGSSENGSTNTKDSTLIKKSKKVRKKKCC